IAINGHIKFNLTIPLQQLNGLETLVIIMVANKYAFLQITRRRFLNEWEAFKKVISRRNIRRRITIPLTLSNLKLLRRITRTENILHRDLTRRQVAIQNRVASNIGISQSTFSVKVLNLFSRSRRKTNKRKSKHSAMLRNKETRHRMFIEQGVEFDNGDMYVDGHKAASDVRDEFVSVTEKLMDELAQCYNVLPQLDINNTIDHRPGGD